MYIMDHKINKYRSKIKEKHGFIAPIGDYHYLKKLYLSGGAECSFEMVKEVFDSRKLKKLNINKDSTITIVPRGGTEKVECYKNNTCKPCLEDKNYLIVVTHDNRTYYIFYDYSRYNYFYLDGLLMLMDFYCGSEDDFSIRSVDYCIENILDRSDYESVPVDYSDLWDRAREKNFMSRNFILSTFIVDNVYAFYFDYDDGCYKIICSPLSIYNKSEAPKRKEKFKNMLSLFKLLCSPGKKFAIKDVVPLCASLIGANAKECTDNTTFDSINYDYFVDFSVDYFDMKKKIKNLAVMANIYDTLNQCLGGLLESPAQPLKKK